MFVIVMFVYYSRYWYCMNPPSNMIASEDTGAGKGCSLRTDQRGAFASPKERRAYVPRL